MSMTELEILFSLLVAAGVGLLLSTWACRSMFFHRRGRGQAIVAVLYLVCAIGTAAALAPYDLSAQPSPSLTPVLCSQVALISALLPFLRQFFAHAMIDVRPGERVRVDGLQGTVAYFGWTGLDLRLDSDDRVIRRLPTWLLDKTITRLPPTNESRARSFGGRRKLRTRGKSN